MDGIPKLLQTLSSMDVVMGLGTGNLERGARIKLERAGLNGYFPFGGFGSDSEDRPELLRIGKEKAERYCGRPILPENVFIVGDTERDILAARRAQFKVIAVATGHVSARSLQDHRPDFFLPDFCDTDAFLKALNGRVQVQN
jgi:phosphoglycolate phosphatase-like HAD superfamily hydrolase